MNSNIQLFNTKEVISSIDISKITGKRHDNIVRDIRNLLSQGVAALNFEEGTYKNANQQDRCVCIICAGQII